MTDDAVPLWVTTRTTAIRGIAYAQGYRFAAHDPLAMGARFSDIEPANQAARDWRRRDLRGPERPRWRRPDCAGGRRLPVAVLAYPRLASSQRPG
jgi:Ni/Co efflux regulator RcnB